MRKHTTAMLASIAALVLLTAGCSGGSEPASSTSSSPAPSSSVSTTHHQTPAAGKPATGNGGNGGTAGPTKTVTQAPAPTRTVTATPKPTNPRTPDSGQQETDCNGPDRGSICNPNHGAGDDPEENGTAPTTTAPQVRDDDPGGKPCTTGMGVSGVYVSDEQGGWVCQIS